MEIGIKNPIIIIVRNSFTVKKSKKCFWITVWSRFCVERLVNILSQKFFEIWKLKFGQSWENIAKYQICGYNSQIGQVGYPWKAIKKAQRRWLQVNRSPQLQAENPWVAIVKFCCFLCPSFAMLQTWPLWRNDRNMFEFILFSFFWAPVSHNVNPLVLPPQLGFPDNVLPHAPFRHKERHICLFPFKIRPLSTVPNLLHFSGNDFCGVKTTERGSYSKARLPNKGPHPLPLIATFFPYEGLWI